MDDRLELLQRRFERERRARKEAESIIEQKSRELYLKGQELERAMAAERQARNEAELLRKAVVSFTSRLDIDEVVAHLEQFLKSLPCESGAIYFLDGKSLRLHGAWGSKEGVAASEMIIAGGDRAISERDAPCELGARLAVPMNAHGRNIGWLSLESGQGDAFDEPKTKLVQALANEAAIALENARLFQEVERLSTVDPLTGLHNRRYFDSVAGLEFERSLRHSLPLSAIMMDIDHFKRVNDTYGHAIGDSVLVEVAAACMRGIRSSDIHARYGGEEFCLLLPQSDLSEASALAERLRASIAELHFEFGGRGFGVTVSCGVACRSEGEDSVEQLMQRSDQALYEAKETGRDRVVCSPSHLAGPLAKSQ